MPGLIIGIVVFILFLITLLTGLFTVEQQTTAIVERFGKFHRLAEPGLHWKLPLGFERVASRQSMRVRQLDLDVETKTHDDVFVIIRLAVQYVIPNKDKVYDAYYKLADHTVQMNSWVFDVVRSKVPSMKLDDVFENKDEIADAVKKSLQERMAQYGWEIVRALVNDIEPDAKVKDAMNEVNRQQRLQSAAQAQGEKEKILVIKKAEAEAESKRLQGEGIANQRRAIINGYRDSIQNFQDRIMGTSAKEVMDLVALTQYFDTLQILGADARSKVIFLPSDPGAVGAFMNQIRIAFSSALEAQTETSEPGVSHTEPGK